jgi:hypothetical protein
MGGDRRLFLGQNKVTSLLTCNPFPYYYDPLSLSLSLSLMFFSFFYSMQRKMTIKQPKKKKSQVYKKKKKKLLRMSEMNDSVSWSDRLNLSKS